MISHTIKFVHYSKLYCSHFSSVYLQPKYLDWKPSEEQLRIHVVNKALPRWEEVCTFLNITYEHATAAFRSNPGNLRQAFFQSLMHWHSGGTSKPVNWESLLEALNASELTEVAKNIQTELGKYIDHSQLLALHL